MPTLSREQTFLEMFFQCIGQFAYDKGRDACDKEREFCRNAGVQPTLMWSQLVNLLSQLASAEKVYTSLTFLGQKWFGRRDNLRSTYSLLSTELRKIEEATKRGQDATGAVPETVEPADQVFEELLGHLCGQIYEFLTARTKTMEFYEQMAVMGTNRNMNFDDLLRVILDITLDHNKSFHHPILSTVKHSFSLECEVIQHLLYAQLDISNNLFLESLLHLNEAHGKLNAWSSLLPAKEGRKLNFVTGKSPPIPALFQWLGKYKALLVAKFGLYFYDVLSKQGDMKPLQSKAATDFYSKIVSFQKKSDVSSFALIFEARGLEGWQKGTGYHHPDTPCEEAQGLESYPALFTYPPGRPQKHWPGLISIMTDRTAQLTTIDKHIYFCDEKNQVTYFLCRLEPRITLAVIFECRKPEKDSYVNTFLVDITTQLRATKLFAQLRPGKL